jgi:hypothetical protein
MQDSTGKHDFENSAYLLAAKAYFQQPPWATSGVAVPKLESQMKHTVETVLQADRKGRGKKGKLMGWRNREKQQNG